jgi:hypothetical protein
MNVYSGSAIVESAGLLEFRLTVVETVINIRVSIKAGTFLKS